MHWLTLNHVTWQQYKGWEIQSYECICEQTSHCTIHYSQSTHKGLFMCNEKSPFHFCALMLSIASLSSPGSVKIKHINSLLHEFDHNVE